MRAIEIIKESRQTHVGWLAYFEKNPKAQLLKKYQYIGDAKHHRKSIKEYDEAIDDIKQLQTKNRQQAKRIKELKILLRITQL